MAATVEGAFIILDRATGPIRRMRREAEQTDKAMRRLGDTLDKVSSQKQSRQLDEQGRAVRNLGREARSAERDLNSFGSGARNAERDTDRLGQSLRKAGANVIALKSIMRGGIFALMAVGIGVAMQAISALSAGLVSLIPQILDAAGALAALPSAAGAALQGLGTVKLAMFGIAAALKAGVKEQSKAGQDGVKAMEQQRAATERVRAAKEALSNTQRSALLAQQRLTEARKAAKREMQDMALAADRSRLSQQRATLSLAQARENFRKVREAPQSTGLDIQDARLNVREAQFGVRDARLQGRRDRKDFAQADRKGLNKMPQVLDARRNVQDAMRTEADAARSLAQAQHQANTELHKGSTSANAFQTAMRNLSPPAQAFVKQLLSMKPQLSALRETAAAGLLPGLGQGISSAAKNLPVIKRIVGQTAETLGGVGERMGDLLGSKAMGHRIELIGRSNAKVLGNVGDAGVIMTRAFSKLMVQARPFMEWLSRQAIRIARYFDKIWGDDARMSQFFQRARVSLERMFHIGVNLYTTFKNIGAASRPLGDALWGSAEKATKRWADWTGSLRGQNWLRNWFMQAKQPLHELFGLVGDLGKAIAGTPMTGLVTTLQELRRGVAPLARLFNNLSATFGPELARSIVQIIRLFSNLSEGGGALSIVLKTFTAMLKIVNFLLEKIPGLATALGAIMSVAILRGAAMWVGRLAKSWLGVAGAASKAAGAQSAATAAATGSGAAGGVAAGGILGRAKGAAGERGNAARGAFLGGAGLRGAFRAGTAGLGAKAMLGMRAAGKFALPVAAITAGMDFFGTQGTLGERTNNTLRMGGLFGPRDLTGMELRERAAATAANASAGGLRGVNRKIREKRGALAEGGFSLSHKILGGSDNAIFGVSLGGKGMDGKARDTARAELKALLKAQRSLMGERNRALNQQSRSAGQRLAVGFGDAFAVYSKARGPAWAMKRTASDVFAQMRKMRPAGARILGENTLRWANQMAKGNPAILKQVAELERRVKASFSRQGKHVEIVNGRILTGSQREWKGIERALREPLERARQFTQRAFTDMQRQAVGSLLAAGFSRSEANKLVKGREAGKNPNVGSALANQRDVSTHGRHAYGGRLAGGGRVPGWGNQDKVKMAGSLTAPGEMVVNRHTERRLDQKLAPYGTTLASEVRSERKPHGEALSLAGGGRLAYGGVTAGMASVIRKLDSMGFHHGSTTGGNHVAGSNHYSGQAVDYGNANNDMRRLWSVVYPKRTHFAELFGPSSLRQPTLSHFGVGFTDPGLQADHQDHIHIAYKGRQVRGGRWAGMSNGGGGGAAADFRMRTKKSGVGGTAGAVADNLVAGVAGGYEDAVNKAIRARGGGSGGGSYNGPLDHTFPRVGSTGGGATISDHQAAILLRRAGMPESTVPTFIRIMHRESGNRPGVVNSIGATGLWQIYNHPDLVTKYGSMRNPWHNAQAARDLSSRGTNLHPWDASGPYAMGGRLPDWGGWHGQGGSHTYRRPTVIGVGDGGPEKVTVSTTADGRGRRGAPRVEVKIGKIENHREGDIEKHVERELSAALRKLGAVMDDQGMEDPDDLL